MSKTQDEIRKYKKTKFDSCETFPLIDADDPKYHGYRGASHCLIYSLTDEKFETYEQKAIVLMQMRFDGYLGFPGGHVEKGETRLEGLNRELHEEINWSRDNYPTNPVSEEDYQFSHLDTGKNLVLHFYAVEVPECMISVIEENALEARDYGTESLGLVRVPLYTMDDNFSGFQAFMLHKFIGNARRQLTDTLRNLGILSKQYIDWCLEGI